MDSGAVLTTCCSKEAGAGAAAEEAVETTLARVLVKAATAFSTRTAPVMLALATVLSAVVFFQEVRTQNLVSSKLSGTRSSGIPPPAATTAEILRLRAERTINEGLN